MEADHSNPLRNTLVVGQGSSGKTSLAIPDFSTWGTIDDRRIERPPRSKIEMRDGIVYQDGKQARVVMTPTKICIGCTDVTAEAVNWLFCQHAQRFQAQTVQMAEGEKSHPC